MDQQVAGASGVVPRGAVDVAAYRALREGCIVFARERSQVLVRGSERASWLQGLLTNDVQALSTGSGCYAAWLTPQGRMLTDLIVLELGDVMVLDVPAPRAAFVMERLDQFVFAEDVQIADGSSELVSFGLAGPLAFEVAARVFGGADLPRVAFQCARVPFGDAVAIVAPTDELDDRLGMMIVVPRGVEERFRAACVDAGALAADELVVETGRIEGGRPRFLVDMDEETIPLEAGIEGRAISRSKGCYVGQEVIIRVLDRGQGRVARRLVGLRVDGEGVPERGTTLDAGERQVGRITSAAWSPALNGAIALGYVHRDFTAPGTALSAGGTRASVVPLPFVA